MSYFGNNTPHQEMLDYADTVKAEFKLSDHQIIIILLKIIESFIDPCETESDNIRKMKKVQQ